MPRSDQNPFPGMNPYLQLHWRDFHASWIVYACDQLNASLPEDLVARINVVDRTQVLDIPPERAIHISSHGACTEVVTSIELISPWHKEREEDRIRYKDKQQSCLERRINLVELDLFRGGVHVQATPRDSFARVPAATYLISVRRSIRPERLELWPISLREALPVVPIPLRPADQDVALQLQTLVNEYYVRARCRNIDYRKPLVPPLPDDDEAWADQLLREQGLRP